MDLQIAGRTAVISGAAGAIALESARFLLDEGCRLILTDCDADELATAVEQLAGGNEVRSVIADLSAPEGADKVLQEGVRGDATWQPGILLHAYRSAPGPTRSLNALK